MPDNVEPTTEITKPEQEKEWYETRIEEFEAKEYRNGFTIRTFVGGIFLGVIMMPGAIYLSYMMGAELGPAAEWTTVILFTEIARRTLTVLRRQELYMIMYITGVLGAAGFAGLIWNQYLVNSPAAENFGVQHMFPKWVAPPFGSEAYIQRSLLHIDWWRNSDHTGMLAILLAPIPLLIVGNLLGRFQWIGMGYALFRLTSDVEKLPFPYAYVSAQGATALAEVTEEKESWRWPVFSIGTMCGLIFGFFYIFIPAFTGGILATPLRLIPIPFIDLTTNAEDAFPTGKIALATDLGAFLYGFIIPFPVVVGSFIMCIFSNFLLSPALFRYGEAHKALQPDGSMANGLFPQWHPGMNLIQTEMTTNFNFWMSVGIGINLAIALIGLWMVGKAIVEWRARQGGLQQGTQLRTAIPPGRGDFSVWLAIGMWFFATVCYVALCWVMIPKFPKYFVIGFFLIWSPLNSYVSARLIGMIGRPVQIPFLAEATFILSKYKGMDIWFAPRPTQDFGGTAEMFRTIELTGTKFTSIFYAEAFILVVGLVCGFTYYAFFWKSSPIPSTQYPYIQTYWPLTAFNQLLWYTSTVPGSRSTFLLNALKAKVIVTSGVGALILYWALAAFKVPVLWFYGLAPSIGGATTGAIPSFIGALIGRFYFAKRFGKLEWFRYTTVLLAGYAAGMGLVGMTGIALSIIFRAVRALPY